MKSLTLTAAAAFLIVSASCAFAKDDVGTIKTISKSGDSITLSDGKVFTLPEGIEAETLKVGERVHVVYSVNAAGKATVSNVMPVK
jgi:hypothetical protein